MQIDKTLISKLEKLARLQLSDEEQTQLSSDLNAILEMVDRLNEVDTSGVAPLVYINEEARPLREDVVKHQLDRSTALKNAPQEDGLHFKVPKVIDL